MMEFIYENLSIVLCLLGILTIIFKGIAWIHFSRLGWESPNPGPREQNIRCFFTYEVISTVLSAFFFFLFLDLFWVWEILIGVLGVWLIEMGLAYLWFIVIENLVVWFYEDTKLGQSIRKREREKSQRKYEEYVRTHQKEIKEEEKILEELYKSWDEEYKR